MNPAWPPFVLTLIAFFFLLLASVSSPIVRNLNFLHAETAGGGVSFGLWGWCIDDGGSCTPVKLGYERDAQVIHWLTYALIFIPIACVFTFIALLSLFPTLFTRSLRLYPSPAFSLLALLAALFTLLAFIFEIALFATAYTRFRADNIPVTWGVMPWLVLVSTVFMVFASIHSGCGTMFKGGRSPYVSYATTTRSYGY